jgi:hypothetical protein
MIMGKDLKWDSAWKSRWFSPISWEPPNIKSNYKPIYYIIVLIIELFDVPTQNLSYFLFCILDFEFVKSFYASKAHYKSIRCYEGDKSKPCQSFYVGEGQVIYRVIFVLGSGTPTTSLVAKLSNNVIPFEPFLLLHLKHFKVFSMLGRYHKEK